ncbi:MAG: site-specific integrase [Lachnospiraceae bacterium]|nr:site-specific integrase [Lachnospiraceae bacterium]MDD6380895.1 site-specific integrase [Lachnospiraceae bacterium]
MARKKTNGRIRKTFTYEGKRYEVTGKTEIEAAEKLIAKRKELETGTIDRHNPKLKDYYKDFTEIRRHEVAESSIRGQSLQFKTIAELEIFKGTKFGDLRIGDITRRDIERAREILLKEGKSTEYINIIFAHLNHVFHTAVLDETIDKNPCEALKQLKRDRPVINETTHRALTESETKRFFAAARERHSFYYNVFQVMIKTGMRVGEVGALRFSDIDTKAGYIHVRRTVTRDEAGGYIVGETTKTAAGKRDIPLTKELLDIFRKQRGLNAFIFGADKAGENDLLFKSVEGTILREYSVIREVKRICKAADIEIFTCHAFRNTFATRFIEQRPQDYKILSEILGHKNIKITLDLYTHVMAEKKKEAMQNVEVDTENRDEKIG